MTARIVAYGNTIDRERALPCVETMLETMETALLQGTARPIRDVVRETIESITTGDGRSDRIIRIDPGSDGTNLRTMEQAVAVVRESVEALRRPWVDDEDERSIRRFLDVTSAIRGHAETVAKGDPFPVRVITTSASPWAPMKSIRICSPPLVVFGFPAEDDGTVMPRMVTIDAELDDGDDPDAPLLPHHLVLRTLSGGWDEEPGPLELLHLHEEHGRLVRTMTGLAEDIAR